MTEYFSFDIPSTNLEDFVNHWSSCYSDAARDRDYYDPHIGKNLQTDWEALLKLYEWKNGSTLSHKKKESVCKNYFKDWVEDADLEARYLSDSSKGGEIWNIFYLHCRRPDYYPIYDQHTDRAMRYIQTGSICAAFIRGRRNIFRAYQSEYRPFVGHLRQQRFELRKIDRALFAFGQFLKLAKPYT